MHCPKCGTQIESDDVRFCSRCGFTLAPVRAVMATEEGGNTEFEVPAGGVNIGIVLMLIGLIPAILGVLSSPRVIPGAFLYLCVVYIAILLGSGKLLRFFRPGGSPASDDMIRAKRKEIAFGSTLMFIGSLLATVTVAALVPDTPPLIPMALVSLIFITFGALLLSSGWLYASFRELTSSGDSLPAARSAGELTTGGLATGDLGADEIAFPTRQLEFADKPPSLTEHTTRHLGKEVGNE